MTREYFYTIDERGRLLHDTTEITDRTVLRQFFRRLKLNTSGRHSAYPYVSPCGPEMNFVRAADTPIVFRRLVDETSLEYAAGLQQPFRADELRFSPEGILYHRAPVGGFGRLDRDLAIGLGADLQRWGPYYALKSEGTLCVIAPLEDDERYRLIRPRADNACVGCGGAHPDGLGLSFLWDGKDRNVYSWLHPDIRMQGKEGWMHGGFAALLLDEVMGKALSANEMRGAPTARLEVSYRRPVPIGSQIMLRASFRKREDRKFFVRGELRDVSADGEGLLLAEGEGLFIRPRGSA